ncbi:NAD-dependent epimerase/dehydratase family protein [Rhodobacterales bacterium FZCC0069]|nr:NAD-dependent epimerase/dehydratase family protein [Rhodobacterales bacterium FZCC0069]
MSGRILTTGASGFVGRALCSLSPGQGREVRAGVRSLSLMFSAHGLNRAFVGELGAGTDWSDALEGVDCVINCAALTYSMYKTESNALSAYRPVNVAGTQRLAEQAAACGVQRFVFF